MTPKSLKPYRAMLRSMTRRAKFYNPKYDRAYTAEEWEIIMTDGREALEKALRLVSEDPKMFS